MEFLKMFLPERSHAPELIDLPLTNSRLSEYAGSLADIRTVNRFLGDNRVTLKHFSSLLPADAGSRARAVRVLDVATGSADIPVAMVKWARRRGIRVEVTAVDTNPGAIREAEIFTRDYRRVRRSAVGAPFVHGSRTGCLGRQSGPRRPQGGKRAVLAHRRGGKEALM